MKTTLLVATVAAATTLTLAPAPAQANPYYPVSMEDGTVRQDLIAVSEYNGNQAFISNGSKEPIEVSYSDPTYKLQTITAPASGGKGLDGYGSASLCVDETYYGQYRLKVTYSPGTPQAAVGYADYSGVVGLPLEYFTRRLNVAVKQLKKAKRQLAQAQRRGASKAVVQRRKAVVKKKTASVSVRRVDLKEVKAYLAHCDQFLVQK